MHAANGFLALGLLVASAALPQQNQRGRCDRAVKASATVIEPAGPPCAPPLAMTLARPSPHVRHI